MAFKHTLGLIGLLGVACSSPTPASPVAIGSGAAAVPGQQQAGHAAAAPGGADGAAETRPRDAVSEPRAGVNGAPPAHVASPPASSAVDGGMTLDMLGDDAGGFAPACDDCCPDGFPRGASSPGARRVFGLRPSSEGVTVCPSGAAFLTNDEGQIWRASLDGSATEPEPWASLPNLQPAGIACDERERLFVAIYGARDDQGRAGLMRIDARGAAAVQLPEPPETSPLASYNGVLAIPGLGVYATDSGAGWAVRFREASRGEWSAEVVARDIPIANGLAYDPARQTLYVASSLGMAVLAFRVAADGSLSDREQVATRAGALFDGVAVDEHGRVYAADYNGGAVIRLEDSLAIAELTNPASFAFRGGTLLVTDYRLNQPDLEGGLYAIDLGACGALTLAR